MNMYELLTKILNLQTSKLSLRMSFHPAQTSNPNSQT